MNVQHMSFYNHQPEVGSHVSAQYEIHQTEEVLDLSCRDGSIETAPKTPSPYNTSSSFGSSSPNTHCDSPISSALSNVTNSINTLSSICSQFPNMPASGATSLYSKIQLQHVKPETLSPTLITATTTATHRQNQLPSHFPQTLQRQMETERTAVPFNPISSPLNQISSTTLSNIDVKSTRPFKAYPRDPLVIAANFAAADVLLENRKLQRYTEFRKNALEEIRNSNGGLRTVTNPKMRRNNSRSRSRSRHNSESEEKVAEESSDCDSHVGHYEKISNNDGNNNSSKIIDGSNLKDAAYYERRRKNNAAAKKSRDRRRIKEDEIAIRAAYLERQNIELLCQLDALKAQLAAVINSNNRSC